MASTRSKRSTTSSSADISTPSKLAKTTASENTAGAKESAKNKGMALNRILHVTEFFVKIVAEKTSVKSIFKSLEYGPAPESPAVANAWLDDHKRSFGHFIDGQWYTPDGRKSYDSFNPSTGEKLASTIQGRTDIMQCPPLYID